MPGNFLNKALTDLLSVYMTYDDADIEELLIEPNLAKKERIGKIDGLEVIIYTHDHNPPHFHVKTKDNKIDAKFLIETGEYISGGIDTKKLKRIKAFYNSPKTKIIMQLVWNKRFQK